MELQRAHLRELCRVLRIHKGRQRPHRRLAMGLEEEDGREPLRESAVPHALQVDRVGDLMQARADDLVGQTFKGVADVDDHLVGVFPDDGHERAVAAVLEFQPAHRVLEQERDDTEVAVRPGALGEALVQLLDRDGRVVVEAELAGGRDAPTGEGALGQIIAVLTQADLARFHDLEADPLAVFKVCFHELSKAGKVGRIGPEVWELRVGTGTAVEVLLVAVALVTELELRSGGIGTSLLVREMPLGSIVNIELPQLRCRFGA